MRVTRSAANAIVGRSPASGAEHPLGARAYVRRQVSLQTAGISTRCRSHGHYGNFGWSSLAARIQKENLGGRPWPLPWPVAPPPSG